MEDYISEEEQLQRIRDWFWAYGGYLLGGVFIGSGLLYGWNYFEAYQTSRSEAAAALYQELREAVTDDAETDVQDILTNLRQEHPSSPYTDQGGLLVARYHLAGGKARFSADELRYVMVGTEDPYLSKIARLRLARVLLSLERPDEALALLEIDAGAFSIRYRELRGDALLDLGRIDEAREAYREALSSGQADTIDRAFVQMKLDDLQPTSNSRISTLPVENDPPPPHS